MLAVLIGISFDASSHRRHTTTRKKKKKYSELCWFTILCVLLKGQREGRKNPCFVRGDISHAWDTEDDDVGGKIRSQGLYVDATLGDAPAISYFESTRDIAKSSLGLVSVIVEAFELSATQWFNRNVVGRLIAVAIGASGFDLDDERFQTMYFEICNRKLEFDHQLCAAFGEPILPDSLHRNDVIDMCFRYSKDLCNRLTTHVPLRREITRMDRQEIVKGAMANFWFRFADVCRAFSSKQRCTETG
jgi:hypothetical protein